MKGFKFTLFGIILGVSDGYLVYHNALGELSFQSTRGRCEQRKSQSHCVVRK